MEYAIFCVVIISTYLFHNFKMPFLNSFIRIEQIVYSYKASIVQILAQTFCLKPDVCHVGTESAWLCCEKIYKAPLSTSQLMSARAVVSLSLVRYLTAGFSALFTIKIL